MNRRIALFWYQFKNGSGNFGDELSPFIIKALTGRKVEHCPIPDFDPRWISFKVLVLRLLKAKTSVKKVFSSTSYLSLTRKKPVMGIGSIISWYNIEGVHVWGSGLMGSTDFVHNAHFHAVRGPYTRDRIIELGYKAPSALGDPALLLPLIVSPSDCIKYQTALIPHVLHFDEVSSRYSGKYKVINLQDPIEKIIEEITSSELILSSSLHGLIVAHAYGLNALWVNFSSKPIGGDNIKFKDYFASVQLEEYECLNLVNIDKDELAARYLNIAKPTLQVVKNIQRDLIRSAPFKVLSKFKMD